MPLVEKWERVWVKWPFKYRRSVNWEPKPGDLNVLMGQRAEKEEVHTNVLGFTDVTSVCEVPVEMKLCDFYL